MGTILLGGGLITPQPEQFQYVSEVVGKGGIIVRLVAYSESFTGKRIATFELEYPRAIHAEMRTHCMLDMNAASSRAIPCLTVRSHVVENTATPVVLTKNTSGMQGKEVHDGWIDLRVVADVWFQKLDQVVSYLEASGAEFDVEGNRIQFDEYVKHWSMKGVVADHSVFERMGLHKQVVNRYLEPYQYIKTIVTATEWSNFFNLRFHGDADPTIIELANCMAYLYYNSTPEKLSWKDAHTPYVMHERVDGELKYYTYTDNGVKVYHTGGSNGEAVKISCCACAQVSYRKLDTSAEKVQRVYDLLVNGGIIHGSAFSHVAWPMCEPNMGKAAGTQMNIRFLPESWQEGVTHADRNGDLWSSKFNGWVQYRKLIPNENCVEFDYEARKKEVYGSVIGGHLTNFGQGG
jgi:hypothetical protein